MSSADTISGSNSTQGLDSDCYQYYDRYPEIECLDKARAAPGGCTIYRSLSRQLAGDPLRYNEIRQQVQRFVFRVSLEDHPLHVESLAQEEVFSSKHSLPLFSALESPDYLPTAEVFWTIAHALKIRLMVYAERSRAGKLGSTTIDIGQSGMPQYRLLQRTTKTRMSARFDSLLPNETGRAVIEFLDAQRTASKLEPSGLQVRQISWAMSASNTQNASAAGTTMECYNEYRPDSTPADLGPHDPLSRMDIFAVVINDPAQVSAALDLLREVLLRAPNQGCNVRGSDGGTQIARPHVATDAEFVQLPHDAAAQSAKYGETKDDLARGHLERLCSVLTFAVGRHFLLSFNVLHMLENANEQTVPALEKMYRELVFNPDIVRLWWNPQSDMQVLDNTIAHMYQGTMRAPVRDWVWERYEDDYGRWRREMKLVTHTPKFRFQSAYFNGTRPSDLEDLIKAMECGLHQKPSFRQDDYQGCPCAHGNIDIAALLDDFCRQQNLERAIVPWGCVRSYFRYGDLLNTMLGQDRLLPLLRSMKNIGGSHAFYQSLGKPDMAQDDDAMAYNCGDVVGINLVFEQLLVNQDKRFVGSILNGYSKFTNKLDTRRRPIIPAAERRSLQRKTGEYCGIPLFEDNPKEFKAVPFLKDAKKPDKLAELLTEDLTKMRYDDSGSLSSDRSVTSTPWEHDQQVAAMRAVKGQPRPLPAEVTLYDSKNVPARDYDGVLQQLQHQQKVAYHTLDPTRVTLPNTMVLSSPPNLYQDPIVRAGSTHAEALVEFLRSSHATGAASPAGFAAAPGSPSGLPFWLSRVPGQGLTGARDILEAFNRRHAAADARLLSNTKLRKGLGSVPAPLSATIEEKDTVLTTVRAMGYTNVWDGVKALKRTTISTVAEETRRLTVEGAPHLLDHTDVHDAEGRAYRRRVEAAEPWNQPLLHKYYETEPDGSFKSQATVTLELLRRIAPERQEWSGEDRDEEGWTTAGSKKRSKGH